MIFLDVEASLTEHLVAADTVRTYCLLTIGDDQTDSVRATLLPAAGMSSRWRHCHAYILIQRHPSAGTPNGQPISILFEELKAVYPDFEYEVYAIDFSKNEQKEE